MKDAGFGRSLGDAYFRIALIMAVFAFVWSIGFSILLAFAGVYELAIWMVFLIISPWVISRPFRRSPPPPDMALMTDGSGPMGWPKRIDVDDEGETETGTDTEGNNCEEGGQRGE